jgi:hypothetical protein
MGAGSIGTVPAKVVELLSNNGSHVKGRVGQ